MKGLIIQGSQYLYNELIFLKNQNQQLDCSVNSLAQTTKP
jgi:hypothetical protein